MISLLLPTLLSFGSGLLLVFSSPARRLCDPFLPFLPWLVLVCGLFLAWRFNRSRLAWTLLLLTAATIFLQFSGVGQQMALNLWLPLLPLSLLIILLLPEKGFFTMAGMARPLSLMLLGGAAALFQQLFPDFARQLAGMHPVAWLHPGFIPSLPIVLAFGGSLLISAIWCWRHPEPLETGLLTTQLLSLPALFHPSPLTAATWFGLAGLAPTLAIVEMSLQMAFRDELTGLRGRRALNESLQRLGARYCVAMLDIDHFKKFNDRHGHDVGDQVLRMVAARLAGVGGGGRPFRYGGEEFAILFPGRGLDECLPRLEELRREIEAARFTVRRRYLRPKKRPQHPKPAGNRNPQLKVTVSIGVAQRQRSMDPGMVIKEADKALYRAKKAGRNRVCR
ncbi:GGDEF domain-containing protein [Geothermobacter hydrogeniphilus]|uniref:diguanylate cyclase n=1 Tax=Geothermobacter hydrogeniphilus TaxID=1969733 RepID=A0A2K2H6C3_9BACT|nr:GGDEF domain-containing protein [Geothermobacter hydrogeniphilus]PNU18763.1 GGDEF domain-containing protein [Geothermobacter hydrogeniphilus]